MDRIIEGADLANQLDEALAEIDAGRSVLVIRPGRVPVKMIAAGEEQLHAARQHALSDAIAHYRRMEPQLLRGWTRDSLYDD